MEINYFIAEQDLQKLFAKAEQQLFSSERIKFQKETKWRVEKILSKSGVYALFEKDKLVYIGETGNLQDRMGDLNRTVNHSFRKQLGATRFGGIKSKRKFADEVEKLLDDFFSEHLYVSFIPVNFGRLEIETFLIDKHQAQLLNAEKKRK